MERSTIRIVPSTPAEVLDFWFALERPGPKDDAAVRTHLGALYEQAAAGDLDAWAEAPRERLALILLLDQVPRHLYRRDARAYATDLKAQGLTGRFFARDDWTDFTAIDRCYVALPWLHAEDAALQARVNPVLHACAEDSTELAFLGQIADLYLETIQRFGYFPHRNALRGRESSEEERRFVVEQWEPRRREILARYGLEAPATGGQGR